VLISKEIVGIVLQGDCFENKQELIDLVLLARLTVSASIWTSARHLKTLHTLAFESVVTLHDGLTLLSLFDSC